MAPAKGQKRGATQVAPKATTMGVILTSPQKRPKAHHPMIVGVHDAIGKAEMLPESCRAMLVAGAPGCLLTPVDQRHELQDSMVNMIGEVLDGIQVKMQATIDTDDAKIKDAQMIKEGHECKIRAATDALAVKAEEVVAKESALDCASQAVLDAKSKLVEAQVAQSKGDADIAAIEKDKQVIEEALNEHVNGLKEGEMDFAEAKKHCDALLYLANRLAFDESLITAIPATCMKKSGDRGGFDLMVINELESTLNHHVTELTALLSARGDDSAERAAKVVALQRVLDEANEDHQRAATELNGVQNAQCEAASILQAAEATLASFLPEYTDLVGVRDNHAIELENFQNYNVLCFTTLSDKMLNNVELGVEST